MSPSSAAAIGGHGISTMIPPSHLVGELFQMDSKRILSRIDESKRGQAGVLHYQGDARLQQGNAQSALSCYRTAMQLLPQQPKGVLSNGSSGSGRSVSSKTPMAHLTSQQDTLSRCLRRTEIMVAINKSQLSRQRLEEEHPFELRDTCLLCIPPQGDLHLLSVAANAAIEQHAALIRIQEANNALDSAVATTPTTTGAATTPTSITTPSIAIGIPSSGRSITIGGAPSPRLVGVGSMPRIGLTPTATPTPSSRSPAAASSSSNGSNGPLLGSPPVRRGSTSSILPVLSSGPSTPSSHYQSSVSSMISPLSSPSDDTTPLPSLIKSPHAKPNFSFFHRRHHCR
jgi:hypothetical protein